MARDNIFTAPFRRNRTHISAGIEGNVNYTDSFSPDPNILGLVIVSSALGVAIARYKLHQINKEPTGYFKVGDKTAPVLSLFSSLTSLTSSMMDFVLTYLAPPGLISLVATQVVWSKVLKNF